MHALSLKIDSCSSPLHFSSSSANKPGRGDYTVPPQFQARKQMVLINWHPPLPSRRKRQRKPSKLPGYGCAFWSLSANRGNSFYTESLSYLREPWENACTAPEGGKKGGERGSWCFSTSASNQSPEITATVYGLWSKLLFRTTRESAGEGEGGEQGKGWESRPRGCGGQGREIRSYEAFWSLRARLDLIQWVLSAEEQVAWNIQGNKKSYFKNPLRQTCCVCKRTRSLSLASNVAFR